MSTATSTPPQTHPVRQSGWLARVDAGLLLILALPALILRFDTTWLFGYAASPSGFIDPWVYFGFFLDLTQHIRTFKGAYFTTRLTWTVPGALVYHLFSPIVATYVLHLAILYASLVPLYLILKISVNQRAAVLATLLMAFHSYFLWSVGWSYIDGPANAYLLTTICALTFASRSARPKRWLAIAGALAAMTVYCQLFLIVFSPVVLGYYHFACRQKGSTRPRRPWKPFAWGFAGVTVIFCVFNMAINGRFLFFINSLGTAAKLVVNHNPYVDSSYGWLSGATWLVLPTVAFVGAILCLARQQALPPVPQLEFVLFWQRYYVLCFATMLFWQIVGQPVLQLSNYTSYLLPSAFLALGSQCFVVSARLRRSQFLWLCVLITALSITPFILPLESRFVVLLQRHAMLLPFAIGAVALAMLNAQLHSLRVAGLFVLVATLTILSTVTGPHLWSKPGTLQDPAYQKASMLAIVDSVRMVQQLDPKANLYFWYDGDGRLGRLYRSVSSTYLWAYRLQSENFPALGPKLPPPGRRILILAENGESALLQAKISCQEAGLTLNVLNRRRIDEGPFRWDVIEIQIALKEGS